MKYSKPVSRSRQLCRQLYFATALWLSCGTGAIHSAENAAANAWELPRDDSLGFVEVPAGPFLMGSDPAVDRNAFENERWSAAAVQGKLHLDRFYIARHEVTVSQFKVFVSSSNYEVREPEALIAPPDHPVSSVSWTDALAYASWLERQLRSSPATPPAVKQLLNEGWRLTLPSEAQWEKAARGTDGRIFPWGNQLDPRLANFNSAGTRPTGSIPCPDCAHGLSDMSGNVWEWTRSPMQPYPYDPGDDRDAIGGEALWVMRGGAFNDAAGNIRGATRGAAGPDVRRPFIGFRLVLTPEL